MNEHKLDSLIALLDDPDNSVFHSVLEELMKDDMVTIDHLERIGETSLDQLVQKRIDYIIHQIQIKETKEKIKKWAFQQTIDLFEGFFLISSHHYPDIKLKTIQLQLERIRKDIWLEFRNSLTSLEKITILNYILFDHYEFTIDTINPDSPQHCYLNKVLDSKKGNPVSITILYTIIAQSLNLPVYYIDFQESPLVGYFDKDIATLAYGEDSESSLLFYINPSNNGAIIGPKEVEYILHTTDVSERKKLIEPCPDRIVLKRLIEKLIFAYNQSGAAEKANYLNEIADIL